LWLVWNGDRRSASVANFGNPGTIVSELETALRAIAKEFERYAYNAHLAQLAQGLLAGADAIAEREALIRVHTEAIAMNHFRDMADHMRR
jgi:hypothetical protein